MDEHAIPLIGDRFPKMEVQTTHGGLTLPTAYAGKWFVLFSHPADFTPVCTTEFVGFQNRYARFKELNTELIGLSVDQVFSHIKWTDWIRDTLGVTIEFPIIAGTETVANRLGLIHPGKGSNTVRAVFIVDPTSVVRAILYYPQELGRNLDEIVRMVEGFQVADTHAVAIPANWPNSELVNDHVILPPPTDQETATARQGTENCFDWWFCHKKL
jgi:peroxiredoxin (alkyl hydroperoxide reductase subunit C)